MTCAMVSFCSARLRNCFFDASSGDLIASFHDAFSASEDLCGCWRARASLAAVSIACAIEEALCSPSTRRGALGFFSSASASCTWVEIRDG